MKLTKSQLKQIIKEELTESERHADESARFSISDLDDIPQQLDRVLTIMKEGDTDAAFRRITGIKGVIQSILQSYYAYEYDK
tara:strand:+ start:276 stop:521 length:246 start_codon:yes stop_codon:yes gene_type:complete